MSPLKDPKLERLLDQLHAQSDAQLAEIDSFCAEREQHGEIDWRVFDEGMHQFFANKLVALDRDKAEFCYQLCRSLNATRIVEAGTSFGVSTIYLAAAVRDNQVDYFEFLNDPKNRFITMTVPFQGGFELTVRV